MSTLVIYYSNTGNTRKVAQLIAERLGAELAEITCPGYLKWYGPLLMAWDIFSRRRPAVEVLVPPGRSYDLVIIGGPVWAARPGLPVLSTLERHDFAAGGLGLFVTCAGDNYGPPRQQAIEEMRAAAHAPVLGDAIFRAADIQSPTLGAAIDAFATRLAGATATDQQLQASH